MHMNWLFGGEGKPRAPVLVMLLVLLGALFLRAADPAELVQLRDFAFDAFQRAKPRVPEKDMPVRIVDIDEAALEEFGQWPWPRTVLATLVDKLVEQGAAVIAFDVVFAEQDRSSPKVIARNLPEAVRNSELRQMMEALPDNDELFAESIARAPVVTGFAFDLAGKGKAPQKDWGVAHNTGERDDKAVSRMIRLFLPEQQGAVLNLKVLEEAGKGNGAVTTDVESAVVRRVPLLFRLAGQREEDLFPSLAAETLRVLQTAPTYIVRWAGAQGFEAFGQRTGIGGIRIGQLNINTDARGRVALYDSGHLPERFVSAKDVVKGTVKPDKIDANIVFVGTSAIGLKDLRNTPIQDAVPGVEIHAQIVEQMLTGVYLERPDYADGAEFLYLALIGLALILLMPWLSAARMAIVAIVFVGIGMAVPWFAFDQFRLLFDPIYPTVTLAVIYVGGSALSFVRTERDRRAIRGAFALYLSPDQVDVVARNPAALELGGMQREITVMFTDVRGFTTISEQFDPQGLTRFMNRFLTPMTDLIQVGFKGTIDKYMGDAIMAFWNAPLDIDQHAARACGAALAMQARLVELNVVWKAEADAEGRRHIPVNIGVGLNTGQATVGNFGSTQRLTYSCLGDQVNLASRLEGQCKTYAVGIIIGDNTRIQVPELAALDLDLIMVKGKTEPVRMHALVGDAAMAVTPAFKTLIEQQATFLAAYRSGAFAAALAAIPACEQAAEVVRWQQGYYRMMAERIEELMENPPRDWIGVYVAKDK